jgi:hypothetical protein
MWYLRLQPFYFLGISKTYSMSMPIKFSSNEWPQWFGDAAVTKCINLIFLIWWLHHPFRIPVIMPFLHTLTLWSSFAVKCRMRFCWDRLSMPTRRIYWSVFWQNWIPFGARYVSMVHLTTATATRNEGSENCIILRHGFGHFIIIVKESV